MTTVNQLKIALALVGVLVWGYGVRADLSAVRWVGIALLAIAAVLRFWGRRRARPAEDDGAGSAP